jgi:hypothetical protein
MGASLGCHFLSTVFEVALDLVKMGRRAVEIPVGPALAAARAGSLAAVPERDCVLWLVGSGVSYDTVAPSASYAHTHGPSCIVCT